MLKDTIFNVIFSAQIDRLNGDTKRRYRRKVNVPGHLLTAEEIEQHIYKYVPHGARVESIRPAQRETLQLDGVV
jgi:hypothetical protein